MGLSEALGGGGLKVAAVLLVPLLLLPLPLLLNSTEDGKLNGTFLLREASTSILIKSSNASVCTHYVKVRLVKNGAPLMWFY